MLKTKENQFFVVFQENQTLLKVSLAPASPHKNFTRVHTGTKSRKAYLLEVLLGLISGGDAMQGSWISPTGDDESAWTIK